MIHGRIKRYFERKDITVGSLKPRQINQFYQTIRDDGCVATTIVWYASVKASAEELLLSMEGVINPLQRELIRAVLDNIRDMDKQIDRLSALVEKHMSDAYTNAAKALDVLPGIGIARAQVIVGELGIDMSRFPNEHHLSSWAGLCPGNNESAGKSKTGRTNQANKTLKTTLTQCAHTLAETRILSSMRNINGWLFDEARKKRLFQLLIQC